LDAHIFGLINTAAMAVVVWLIPLQFIPFFIWLERKGSAIIQDRIGPNRAEILGFRLFGMIHNLADVVKLMTKEGIVPANANRFYYLLAPLWSMTLCLVPLSVIPLAHSAPILGHEVYFQVARLDVGILFVLAVTSLGVFGIMMGGWASNNKFSLMGGLRSSAQMISYELSMGLAIVGVLMVYGTVRAEGIVEGQGNLIGFFGQTLPLPGWGVFLQPVGFLIFLVASFAETNRSPFDLAEGESELVAGYHVEYSAMKFALFFMAEYSNMVVAAFLVSTLYFGGYQVPYASTEALSRHPGGVLAVLCLGILGIGSLAGVLLYKKASQQKALYTGMRKWEPYLLSAAGFVAAAAAAGGFLLFFNNPFPEWAPPVLTALLQALCLLTKVLFFCWFFVWVRWSMPRFRYDQLMKLGWKLMLPLALLNLLVTGIVILAQK